MAKEFNNNSWYVKDKSGRVRGPLSEVEMRKQVRRASVLQVKQGHSTWYPSHVIRNRKPL